MRWKRSVAYALLILVLVAPQPLAPAVIFVGSGPTSCSLSDAIGAANSDKSLGWCPAGSGPDTLRLLSDVTLTSVANSIDGANGLPSVTSKITIEGGGHTIERSMAAPDFRILHVAETGDLTLQDVTVMRGKATGANAVGGAIYNRGSLALVNSTVKFSAAIASSGSAAGGAIDSRYGDLRIWNGRVGANEAEGSDWAVGGGVAAVAGQLEIRDSIFYDNVAEAGSVARGGGILMGIGTISNSTFLRNQATGSGFAQGGGIWAGGVALTNSTLSSNTASADSGLSYGGGIYAGGTIRQATFYGNTADYGAAVASGYGTSGYSANVSGSLFAISTGGHCDGNVLNVTGNLADNSSCGTVPTGLVGVDPVLKHNGGPTTTHALLAGSHAINAGGSCSVRIDQRGAGRMGTCDSGAYEWIGCDLGEIIDQTFAGGAAASISCHTTTIGPGVVIGGSGGSLGVTAGYLVGLRNGVEVKADGTLTVAIDPSLLPK